MLIFSFFFFLCVLGENAISEQNEDIELFQFFRAHVPFKTKREKKNSRHACKTSVPLIVPGGKWDIKSGKAKLVCGSEGRKPRKKLKAICNREKRWEFNLDPSKFDTRKLCSARTKFVKPVQWSSLKKKQKKLLRQSHRQRMQLHLEAISRLEE